MTYEELYKSALEEYSRKWESYFSQFQVRDYKNMNIIQMQEELDSRKAQLAKLEAEKPSSFDFNISEALEQQFKQPLEAYARTVEGVRKKYEDARAKLVQRHADAVVAAEQEAENSVSGLTKKYDTLLTYKDKVADVILRYGIKPSTIQIDEENLSREEMEALIDTALSACKFLGEDSMRQKLKSLYEPPEDEGKDIRKPMAATILILTFVLAPVMLVGLYGYMFWHTAGVYRNVEALRIADKLMYGVNFSKFRDAPKYDDIPEVDYSELDAAEKEELEKLAAGDPAKMKAELQQSINKQHSKIAEDFRSATNRVMGKYDSMLRIYRESVDTLQKLVDDYISKMKTFGSECNASYVMNTQFTLGQQRGTLDVKYDIGLKNIVFANRSPEMMLFIKLMLANAMLSVRPKQFRCVVYDPEGLGADFATFMSQETAEYISVATNDFSKNLDEFRSYAQNNLRILDQLDINTFNKDAEEKGMVTLEYRLLIVVSGVDKIYDNKILMEFMQFSARTGALVWIVAPKAISGCTFYKAPFDGVQEPYPLSAGLFGRVMSTYVDAFNTLKDKGILYKQSFGDKYLPEEDWWKENTDKGIKLNFGLQDGDPSKGYSIELGDANVHALCVGATGAGKSAFNNQLIASLVTRYPPSALELVMIDFKNIEFGSLVDKKTHISRIPHAKIIAGTKDGEYAISVFDYLMSEMERRTRIFDGANVKKVEDYNKKMRIAGTPEKCLPRVLLLIDEFQVMFTEVDAKSVDVIQGRIRSLSKLARFCGCHMLFTSQSMKGTMPKDILDQFSLRIALRCSSDTSQEIIGSPIASKIKQKFGYLYTNTNAGETQDSTRMWRTPFLPDEDLFDTEKRNRLISEGSLPAGSVCILDAICKMAEERHEKHHHAYFYDEKEFYPDSKLKQWLSDHADIVVKEERLVILGERTGFSQKTAPVNFKLKRTDGENILFYGFEEVDFNNLCMTMVTNILANPNAKLLINCADLDLFNVLAIEEWYDPDFLSIARPMTDVSEWIDTLLDMIESRKEMDPSEYGPIYFMPLRWDKQLGICVDENYRLVEKWKSVLTSGPAVDIHILWGVQLHKPVPSNVMSLFNHTICARGPEDAGYKFQNNGKMAKLPDSLGFALYQYGTAEYKFKIYQHTFTRKAESRELDI